MSLVCSILILAGTAAQQIPLRPGGKPIEVIRQEALHSSPPKESGDFLPSDLVELITLDNTMKLDIRYATTDNFLGTQMYTQARAFLQRPAAEAALRAHRKLGEQGYGLLIFDGYRPWYVTYIFRAATPREYHSYVADPAKGSKHNRGCAVDLTIYDRKTGKPVPMPSGYDEFTPRAHPGFAGGTATERANRDLLRRTMEAEGFTVDAGEWWHYDYKDWRRYRIGNIPFEKIEPSTP